MNQRKIEEEIIGVHEEELATLSKRDCRGGKLVWMRGGRGGRYRSECGG